MLLSILDDNAICKGNWVIRGHAVIQYLSYFGLYFPGH